MITLIIIVIGTFLLGGYAIKKGQEILFISEPNQNWSYVSVKIDESCVEGFVIAKNISSEKIDLMFFMDITNILGLQYISTQGFDGGDDWRDYLESLHLPMYDGEEYLAKGYTGGDDRLGDVYSKNKPHINMPNRQFLTYLNPRRFTIGFRYNF